MTRINVYTYPAADEDPTYGEQPTVAGWFDPDKATAIEEDTDWDGNNHISVATGSKWEHEILYRTAKGRWVLHHWSQWQGSMPTYRFASDNEARDWLIKNGRDAEVEEYFGALDEEAGPDRGGRPEIGPAIQIRLGELLAPVDERAAAESVSRAEMVRRLVATGLAVPATRTLADVMPPATPLYRGQVERRELAGAGRGGKQRAAAALGVSWTQIQRALGEDVVRRVRVALSDWDRGDYVARVVGDRATVGLGVAMMEKPDTMRLNAAYGLLNDLAANGLSCSADGMARDVGGQGPGQALVRGDEIDVTIQAHSKEADERTER